MKNSTFYALIMSAAVFQPAFAQTAVTAPRAGTVAKQQDATVASNPPAPLARPDTPPVDPETKDVPALDRTAALPGNAGVSSAGVLSRRQSVLSPKEKREVALAQKWIAGNPAPEIGIGGHVVMSYGAALPTIICAPLYVCDVELQAGETVNNINIGDPVQWSVTPATTGEPTLSTVHVTIKPHDVNLDTNIQIFTNRRLYVLRLVSRAKDWMPFVSFTYPEDTAAQWAALAARQMQQRQATVMADTGQDLTKLDFNYSVHGDKPDWRPVRVYTDGTKTFIQFPHEMKTGDSPVLVGLDTDGGAFSDPSTQIVNYRIAGDRYVVDKVLTRAALLQGVGSDQVKVEIDRDSK